MSDFVCSCHSIDYLTKKNLNNHIWYYKNREKHIFNTINYQQEHKEEIRLKKRQYCKENKDRIAIYAKKYFKILVNSLRQKENIKEWYLEHKEERKRYISEYFKSPKGKLVRKAIDHNHRTILLNSSKLTLEVVQQVYERNIKKFTTLTCELCFEPIKFGEDELEHFIAVTRHKDFPTVDLNAIENLGVAHGIISKEKCNKHKHNKTLDEWFKLHPEYLLKKEK